MFGLAGTRAAWLDGRVKDYSQNNEQGHILRYFGNTKGAFLDCGANDGRTLSNTHALALLGWSGICVEPAPIAFSKLVQLYQDRPDIRCVNAAITTRDGPIDFYDSGTHLRQGDTSLLSTTRPEELARWRKSGEQFTKTTVRGITFRTLMEGCGYGIGLPALDFITIDAEGADYSILSQIDLAAVGCRLLCVEVNGKDDSKFAEYAARHGMKLHWKNFENRIYAQ